MIAGHDRVMAATQLGLAAVPVLCLVQRLQAAAQKMRMGGWSDLPWWLIGPHRIARPEL